jgi:hypothetical protein
MRRRRNQQQQQEEEPTSSSSSFAKRQKRGGQTGGGERAGLTRQLVFSFSFTVWPPVFLFNDARASVRFTRVT